MYVNPITRQTFNFATPIECDNNPQNIIELDPNSNETDFYILTPEPVKKEPPQMFKPTQIKTNNKSQYIYSPRCWNLFQRRSKSILE